MRTTKYEQLAAYLKQEYILGKETMSPLPSIPRLMESRGISQATVDRALSLLEQEGLILKKPGVGCFVAESAKQLNATASPDHLALEIARSGHVQRPPIRTAVCSMPGNENPMWTALAETMAAQDLQLELIYHDVSTESYQRLMDAEEPVDLVYASPANIDRLASEGLLMDLSGFARPWEAQVPLPELPSQVARCVVPYSYVARVVLFDESTMQTLGYDFSRGWSWPDFRQVCLELRKLVDGDAPVLLLDDYLAFFSQWGIDLYNSESGVRFDDDRVAEALHYLRELYQQVKAFPLCSQLNLSGIVDVLTRDTPALCIGRTPWKTRLQHMGTGTLGMWPVPLSDDGFQTLAINYLGIYRFSYFPERAWEAIRFICGETGQRIIDDTHLEFPLFATGSEHPHAHDVLRRLSTTNVQGASTAILHSSTLPSIVMDEFTSSIFNPELESFLRGETDTRTCMSRITRIGSTMVQNAIAHRKRIGLL